MSCCNVLALRDALVETMRTHGIPHYERHPSLPVLHHHHPHPHHHADPMAVHPVVFGGAATAASPCPYVYVLAGGSSSKIPKSIQQKELIQTVSPMLYGPVEVCRYTLLGTNFGVEFYRLREDLLIPSSSSSSAMNTIVLPFGEANPNCIASTSNPNSCSAYCNQSLVRVVCLTRPPETVVLEPSPEISCTSKNQQQQYPSLLIEVLTGGVVSTLPGAGTNNLRQPLSPLLFSLLDPSPGRSDSATLSDGFASTPGVPCRLASTTATQPAPAIGAVHSGGAPLASAATDEGDECPAFEPAAASVPASEHAFAPTLSSSTTAATAAVLAQMPPSASSSFGLSHLELLEGMNQRYSAYAVDVQETWGALAKVGKFSLGHREKILDLCDEFVNYFSGSHHTVFFAASCLDRALSACPTFAATVRELRCLVIACALTACKNLQVVLPAKETIRKAFHDVDVAPHQIQDIEVRTLAALRFRLQPVTLIETLDIVLAMSGVPFSESQDENRGLRETPPPAYSYTQKGVAESAPENIFVSFCHLLADMAMRKTAFVSFLPQVVAVAIAQFAFQRVGERLFAAAANEQGTSKGAAAQRRRVLAARSAAGKPSLPPQVFLLGENVSILCQQCKIHPSELQPVIEVFADLLDQQDVLHNLPTLMRKRYAELLLSGTVA